MSNPWNIPLYSGRQPRGGAAPTLPEPTVPTVCYPPGAVLWLDGDRVVTIIAPGGRVQQWTDRSGQNNHAVQPLADRRPTPAPFGVTM